MTKTSRLFRALGSIVFGFAGFGYVQFPPQTTSSYFDASWPAIAWGWIFILGGLVSLLGVITRYVHVERFGVLCVVTASASLALAQGLVMFADPITWTRMGGTLVYMGLAVWALERWHRLGVDERAINAVADRSPGERIEGTAHQDADLRSGA